MDLARKVLDARLKLTRLRQAYPQPRLTVPSAEAQLDAQVLEMQTLEDELQHMNENVEAVKDRVKASARDVERLRIEKGEAEKLVKMSKSEEEDGKVIGLYHWSVPAHFDSHSLTLLAGILSRPSCTRQCINWSHLPLRLRTNYAWSTF